MGADWTGALSRARAYSPFLSQALNRLPELEGILAAGDGEGALEYAHNAGADMPDVAVTLRRERLALSLALAIGDLANAFPLTTVMRELSALADRALDQAIADAIRRRVPDAEPGGFLALALGKQGARELNYSSDIDPILLYDPALLPRRERDDPGEAAQRVARTVVETLSGVTDEGYVFRIDLRLRPASEVSPLAISLGAALAHYESSALTWERAAFIRARACAGDVPAGERFLAAIRPFVWRKSLDFGAIAEIGRLTAQIRTHHEGTGEVAPGFDLKRGRGGIREIEFYAQSHQLVHGGRNPALRVRGTRATLDALAAAGLIPAEDARLLGESYDRLRTIEHRLQMVADRQTHRLPADPDALDSVARLDDLPHGAALVHEIEAITQAVAERYDALIAASSAASPGKPAPLPDQSDDLSAMLEALGFAEPAALAERIAGWRSGKFRALRSDAARSGFETIQPQLLAALAKSPEPDRAVIRWEQLLGNLPSAINLFHLLEARPGLLELLARILSLAPTLADALARRADLLDPLIDASAFDLPGDVAHLIERLDGFEPGADYERVLDSVRRHVGELRFALGVQLIEGAQDPLLVSEALSRTAEAAIEVLGRATIAEFERAHGRIPGSELVVLGLGRLGGGALTHASDLDLIYLFSGDPSGESDGPRPLGPATYFNRLAQRVSAALSVPTAEGVLYEVDTRLRPSGTQGPIAVSFAALERYQMEQAWTWEHMALCRARPLFGSNAARDDLGAIVRAALTKPRDPAKLRRDVLEMRAEMARHKPPKGPLDVKLMRGGLVDLEFIVHHQQLRHGRGLEPGMEVAIERLAAAGLLPASLIAAREALARVLVASRLIAPDGELPPATAREVLAKACLCGDWHGVLSGIAEARRAVATAWSEIFDETLEIDAVETQL
ncbi:MAG TPA: bifunctional [glutamine synthetase] adenylyltransferase/[glutamine synthetase]-adenylyl-L-tyrosine phosphorylase [Novosphingobium sp.]|nr:bifunctional [glutamine synthetase] adenylyltransferase/[glutamine synthetase]-adenylyl-L-tyrosine phosphorylase [Novosphingobium sp.]